MIYSGKDTIYPTFRYPYSFHLQFSLWPTGLQIYLMFLCFSFMITSCHHPTLNWVTNTNWPISCALKVWFGVCSRMVALRAHFCTKLCFEKHSSVDNFILEFCHLTYETGAHYLAERVHSRKGCLTQTFRKMKIAFWLKS